MPHRQAIIARAAAWAACRVIEGAGPPHQPYPLTKNLGGMPGYQAYWWLPWWFTLKVFSEFVI